MGRLARARWATIRASSKSAEVCPAISALPAIDYAPERRVERLRCNTFAPCPRVLHVREREHPRAALGTPRQRSGHRTTCLYLPKSQ